MEPHAARPPLAYILPTVAWAVLLAPIAHDAPSGAVLEVHTDEMQALMEHTLVQLGRPDLVVHLRSPRHPLQDHAA